MTEINIKLLEVIENSKAECKSYADNKISDVRVELKSDISNLSERLSLVEGQAARLAALESSVQKLQVSIPNPNVMPPLSQKPYIETENPKKLRFSFGPQMSSTTFSPQLKQFNTDPHSTFPSQPTLPSTLSNNLFKDSLSTQTNFNAEPRPSSSLNNTSILSQEKFSDVIPEFNGYLTPVHPEAFLVEVNDYFQFQDIPDYLKINIVRRRMTGDAKQWFNALTPPPNTFFNFIELFRQHFWSYSKQLMTRNELSRPYSHRDTSTLQKHAIEWINKAKYLNPPIENETLIFQILSHFPETVASPLRILRIKTLNELIDHLSYAEHSYRPSNSNNFSNNPSYSYDNSQNNRPQNHNNRNNSYQNRFHGRAPYNNSQPHNSTNNSSPNLSSTPNISQSPPAGNDQ
ncbi:uncharacterized protein LOC126909652 [Daktulosphaira vitifoliae]|uniref:uncharacterized protein LOC126909652 n=1 Tax=Daktulosphaira vitifoliae TaxID=58002 RepID=UPI0021A9AF40|nr:uncharacterized protein LOC126909652 [Daktulosphaira vitifoliae]